MGYFELGKVYRYPKKINSKEEIIDSFQNFYHITRSVIPSSAQLDKGINSMAMVSGPDGKRRPAILTRSSPHKAGSSWTPWDDIYDLENGRIRYYGDNKSPDQDPYEAPGNKALIEQFSYHSSPDIDLRKKSAPILFFKAEPQNGKSKGFLKFYGYGIISNVELITQYDRQGGLFFSNFVFDFIIFNMTPEQRKLDWDWINSRDDKALSIKESEKKSPWAWRQFIKEGMNSVNKLRHSHIALLVKKTEEQKVQAGSPDEKILKEIYEHYSSTNRFHFEALAEKVTARIFSDNGARYKMGWVTTPSSDGGADFIGRLDLGSEFATVKVIVLGQAKCEKIDSPTGGNHIARTVARLKRGWVGAYVTTSYFSEAVQREVLEDEYPILLIHGKRLVQEVSRLMSEEGFSNLSDFLLSVDSTYQNRLQNRKPEDILNDFSSIEINNEFLQG